MESTLKKMYKETMRDHSSTIPHQQKTTSIEKNELLNIIHDQLTKPSTTTDSRPLVTVSHAAIQCTPSDFNPDTNHSYPTIIGHALAFSIRGSTPSVAPPPGFNERGIQVDLDENSVDSLANLIELYSERLSSDMVKQFYEVCNFDAQWARTQIDEYLQHSHIPFAIPSLRQLSFNALNQWDEQIKNSNPSFDTLSIGDLLQDITDEQVFDELIFDNEADPTTDHVIEFSDAKQMTIPWTLINSLQELYGELPTNFTYSKTTDGLSLPLDDELSLNIYQALQRFSGVPNKIVKPVSEKKSTKEHKKIKKQQQQQWVSPVLNNSNQKTNVPSIQDIIKDELKQLNTEKPSQKRPLDFASQHKLKELERHFPSLSSDVIYDIFTENESDYDLTFVCISSMLDDNALISTIPKLQALPSSNTRSTSTIKPSIEPELGSFDNSRRHARDYALKRKECYTKADQANRQGMIGVASYYINQAREQTLLMKEANRQACEYLSRTRLAQFRQTHRLDLHELHADEALHLFQQVEQELGEGHRRTTPKSIEIITGYGKNSPYGGGSGKIRSTILTYIRQKNYKYSEPNKGAILVQL